MKTVTRKHIGVILLTALAYGLLVALTQLIPDPETGNVMAFLGGVLIGQAAVLGWIAVDDL